jgi:hypothetical protein
MRSVCIVAVVSLLAACAHEAAAPHSTLHAGHEVDLTVHRAEAPLPDDCDAQYVDGDCSISVEPYNELTVHCANLPRGEEPVASITACLWGGEDAVVKPLACRVGGDTIVRQYALTDSCVRHGPDGMSGTASASYLVYRRRHPPSPSLSDQRAACTAAMAAAVRADGRDVTYFLDAESPACADAVDDATAALGTVADVFPWDPVFGTTTVHCPTGTTRCDAIGRAARVTVEPISAPREGFGPEKPIVVPEAAARCVTPGTSFHRVSISAGCGFAVYDVTTTCAGGRFDAHATKL